MLVLQQTFRLMSNVNSDQLKFLSMNMKNDPCLVVVEFYVCCSTILIFKKMNLGFDFDAILCRKCWKFIIFEPEIENYNPVSTLFVSLSNYNISENRNHRILCKCKQTIGCRDMDIAFFNPNKLVLIRQEDGLIFLLQQYDNMLGMLIQQEVSSVESELEVIDENN